MFNSLALPQPLIRRIERSREFGARRVAALARVGRAFCGGAIPTGRGLRWASAFEHFKTSNNSLQGCREFPLQHCHIFSLSAARCGIQVGCNSVAASGVEQSLGGGGSKSRRARDAKVRSGALVTGPDCAARGVGGGGACSWRRRLKALTPSVCVFSPSAAGAGDSCAQAARAQRRLAN